jgi:5-oxoprolinase (ATP-hydrolysing) subunit A
MLGIVTSANVACGFHAGDPVGLLRVCRSAAERSVRIGAQVSYRDLAGFGRRFIDVAAEDLLADVVYQIGALQTIAQAAGSAVSYVKPHGALYNTIVTDSEQAAAMAETVRLVDAALPVLGMAGSAFFGEAARLGLRAVAEAFADRAYLPDGQLVSRREPGAVLYDPAAIAEVAAVDGSQLAVSVESVCVQGDSPDAVQIAAAVRDRLKVAGTDITAFC